MGRVVDKSRWPRGAWDDEPDEVWWDHLGVKCNVARNSFWGHLCGYVVVPEFHPIVSNPGLRRTLDVHGGVWTDPIKAKDDEGKDCLLVGFDCHHIGDWAPGDHDRDVFGSYRSLDYVKRETEELAVQLTALAFARVEGGAA